MDLNKAMIIGHITKDPEVKNTPQGTSVASFSIATNFVWNDANGQKQEKVEFHNIVAWRKLADICGQYLKKGSKVYIEGRLQTRDWTGQDGVKRYRTEILAENLIMLDKAPNSGNYSKPAAPNQFNPQPQTTEQPQASAPAENDDEIRIENIPF